MDSTATSRGSHTAAPDGGTRRSPVVGMIWRTLALLVVLALWFGIGAVGGIRQGQLSDVQDNDLSTFLPTEAESTRAGEIAAEFVEEEALPVIAVATRGDGEDLSEEDVAALREVAEAFPDVELAEGVPASEALISPVIPIPSEDGKAMMLLANIDGELARGEIAEGVSTAGAVVGELRTLLGQDAPEGVDTWVTGPGGFVADLSGAFAGIDGILLVVALIVVFVILVIVYRSPSLPITVLLTSVFALCLAGLIVYELAVRDVLVLNGQTQGILSILVVGAATDYCLLIVARYREALSEHESTWRAMHVAVKACIPPIAASAGTVIVGLLCLLLSDLASNAMLGPVGAIGIASSVVAALTLLPALLLIGGSKARWIFWPRIPRVGHDGEKKALGGVWGGVARVVGNHSRPVWVLTAVVLAVLAAFLPTFKAEGTGQTDIFLQPTEAVDGEKVLEEHFAIGGVTPAEIITTSEKYEDVIASVEAVDGVESATVVRESTGMPEGMPAGIPMGDGEGQGPPPGVMDQAEGEGRPADAEGRPAEGQGPPPGVMDQAEGQPAQGMPAEGEGMPADAAAAQEEAPVKEIDGYVLVEVATELSPETQEGVAVVREVRAAAHEADPDALVGGAAAERIDTQQTAQDDIRTIIPIVLVVILVMLMILLRAIVAPVMLLAANVLSFAATLGLSALVFNHVFDFPGADAAVPLQGFVFLVALSIDYSIFLMTRAREEAVQYGTRRGVLRALAVTGGVITSAGLVLAATFGALVVIPLLFMAQLAFIVAVGVIIDTFLVRSLLVAGFTHDLGDKSWWPYSRPMREATERDESERAERARHREDVPAV